MENVREHICVLFVHSTITMFLFVLSSHVIYFHSKYVNFLWEFSFVIFKLLQLYNNLFVFVIEFLEKLIINFKIFDTQNVVLGVEFNSPKINGNSQNIWKISHSLVFVSDSFMA